MEYGEIGVAVIGAGFMGPTHVEALRRLGLNVRGIAGATQAEATGAAHRLGLPNAYASFEAALTDAEVHAVHITTPNRLHHPMVVAALEAGKHVLCEKPLAMDSTESADLVARAAKSGKHAAVNYNMRFYPLNIEAASRVRAGEIGAVHSVSGSYTQDWLLYPEDYNWRVLAAEGGTLRAIADVGTHWLDLVHAITGLEVAAVFADLKVVHPIRHRPLGEVQTYKGKEDSGPIDRVDVEIETEDQGAVLLRFKGGATGVLWVSQATAGRKNRLQYEIGGGKTAIYFDSERPNELWLGHRERANETLLKDPSLLGPVARSHASYPGGHNEGYPDTFKQSFKSFYDAIRGVSDGAPYATFADGHREILICEAVLQSHQTQSWVAVAS